MPDIKLTAALARVAKLEASLTVCVEQAEAMVSQLYAEDYEQQGAPQYITEARALLVITVVEREKEGEK